MTNWKDLIIEEMENHEETFEDVVECTLNDEELLVEFDDGYGCSNGLNINVC